MKININYGKNLTKYNTTILQKIIYLHFLNLKNKNLNHTPTEINRLFTSEKSCLFTVIKNGIIIGYLLGEIKKLSKLNPSDNRTVFYITYLYVIPEFRNKGLGNMIMKQMFCFFKKMNINGFMLTFDTKNKKNKDFYQKKSFMPDNIFRTFKRFDVYYRHNI